MTNEVHSGMICGIKGQIISIQSDVSDGLPMLHMIGYLASEVREAKERVRTALKNSGFHLPVKRIAINLSPGDLKKNGVYFDTAIAISLLSETGIIVNQELGSYIILGELALDGRLRPIKGVLPILYEAYQHEIYRCILPYENKKEAEFLEDFEVFAFHSLKEVVMFLNNSTDYFEQEDTLHNHPSCTPGNILDFSEIKGQILAKKAMVIAAAGFHNILLEGSPGSGKSMLASALPGIMPDLTSDEQLDVLMIHSAKGILDSTILNQLKRPFRSAGAGITKAGLIGGGRNPAPGEVTLAHHGILFLDELAEMDKATIELLRTPLENHCVDVIRNEQQVIFPADFLFVCACNPCPCGYANQTLCRCTESQIRKYQSRISGPIRDRIDLFVHCDSPSYEDLSSNIKEESSTQIAQRVQSAWQFQFSRQGPVFNARLNQKQIRTFCQLNTECEKFMKNTYKSLQLTGRSYHKILKVARTIADLRQSPAIELVDLEEALFFRHNNL